MTAKTAEEKGRKVESFKLVLGYSPVSRGLETHGDAVTLIPIQYGNQVRDLRAGKVLADGYGCDRGAYEASQGSGSRIRSRPKLLTAFWCASEKSMPSQWHPTGEKGRNARRIAAAELGRLARIGASLEQGTLTRRVGKVACRMLYYLRGSGIAGAAADELKASIVDIRDGRLYAESDSHEVRRHSVLLGGVDGCVLAEWARGREIPFGNRLQLRKS